MTPSGKGIIIWKGRNCAGGTISAIVQACQGMGLRWVALKIGDAASASSASFPGQMAAAVKAFREAGISVWGWHYVSGGVWIDKSNLVHLTDVSPAKEADFAKLETMMLGLDGYIIDAEREYKVANPGQRAERFMTALHGINCPVALCSYRFPTLHREFPWDTFLEHCDLHMPQVYWQPGGAVNELDRSMIELSSLALLPVVPVGRAYIGDGHPNPAASEIVDFLSRASEQGCEAVSFWALDFLYLHTGGRERGKAISAFNWDKGDTAQQPPRAIGRIRILGTYINVRAGASTTHVDVGDLANGTEWYAFEESGPWARIGHNVWVKTGPGLAQWVERFA